VRAGLVGAGTFSAALSFLLLAAAGSHAQTPPASAPPSPPSAQASAQPKPVTGFVSSYEILRTVRAAGFDPLAPPLREGTTYVLRATDFRGILMRVVLDARTGVIRDVSRIVSATPGPYGMIAPPYRPPPYASLPYGPPYGSPAEYDAPASEIGPAAEAVAPPSPRPAAVPTTMRPSASAQPPLPPLPRPRPATLASQKTEKPKKTKQTAEPPQPANLPSRTGANANAVGVKTGAAPPPSATPGRLPPLAPLND